MPILISVSPSPSSPLFLISYKSRIVFQTHITIRLSFPFHPFPFVSHHWIIRYSLITVSYIFFSHILSPFLVAFGILLSVQNVRNLFPNVAANISPLLLHLLSEGERFSFFLLSNSFLDTQDHPFHLRFASIVEQMIQQQAERAHQSCFGHSHLFLNHSLSSQLCSHICSSCTLSNQEGGLNLVQNHHQNHFITDRSVNLVQSQIPQEEIKGNGICKYVTLWTS